MVQKRVSRKSVKKQVMKKRRSVKRRSSKKQVGGSSKKLVARRSKLRKSLDFLRRHRKSIGAGAIGLGAGAAGFKYRHHLAKKAGEAKSKAQAYNPLSWFPWNKKVAKSPTVSRQ